MPDSVFGCNINTILISRFGWFPAEHGAYFLCLFGIHPVSNNKSSLFQFCFTAHYATALKSFFPFTQLLHYFFQIPALLRNWMEQITQSYSSAIGKQGSVNYVLVGAFSQILSVWSKSDSKNFQFPHCKGHCFFIWTHTSFLFHVASSVWCFTVLYIMVIWRTGHIIC